MYSKDFGSREGNVSLVVKSLYGLCMSAEQFRSLLANFLQTLGLFRPDMIVMFGYL